MFGDPSRSIIARSRPSWSAASRPRARSASSPFTFATACETPLPAHAPPPSRSSTASCTPVDAPDGTIARPSAPDSRRTSTSTVGLPRESRTCRAPNVGDRHALLLCAVVVRVLLVERERRPILAVGGRERLRRFHARAEPLRRSAQLELRVDVELARDVHRREEHVAELVRGDSPPSARAMLVVEVGDRAREIRVLEADRARPHLHLLRVRQRRAALPGTSWKMPSRPSLSRFMGLPALADVPRGLRLGVAEHVRVARDELRVDRRARRSRDRRRRAPAGAARGSRTGRGGRRSRRAASRRRRRTPRPRPRTPPRPCSGTIVRVVCSRSHGHSRRRRSVSACSSTSASASDNGAIASSWCWSSSPCRRPAAACTRPGT